jgi:hypothetical protein
MIELKESPPPHIAHGSPTDVRQKSYWDIQNIRWMSEGPPHIRTGGRSEVGITLEDLPKSVPTDVEQTSKFHSVEINIYFLSLTLPLTSIYI